MTEAEHIEQIPIQPVYEQACPNKAIEIGEFSVKCRFGGKNYLGTAIAKMEFSISPKLRFHAKIDVGLEDCFKELLIEPSDTNSVTFLEKNVTLDCHVNKNSDGTFVFSPFSSMVSVVESAMPLDHVILHLLNFPKFNDRSEKGNFVLHPRVSPSKGARSCSRTFLEAMGWQVTITEIENTPSVLKLLKTQGGYAITHVAKVVRSDGAQFSAGEFTEVLDQLQRFLSFALGRWAGLSFPVGFDVEGKIVYEEWGTLRVSRDGWRAGSTWFDAMKANLLNQVWSGFCVLSQRPEWQDKLQMVIAWYVAANEQGTSATNDIRICMAESALELIVALQEIPKGRRSITQQIELLTSDSYLDLPQEIPAELGVLASYSSVAEAIVKLRNEVAHAKSRETVVDSTWYQGWRLSMWYLDLILLKLCNHNGNYANRLAKRYVGTVEPVPWAPEQ